MKIADLACGLAASVVDSLRREYALLQKVRALAQAGLPAEKPEAVIVVELYGTVLAGERYQVVAKTAAGGIIPRPVALRMLEFAAGRVAPGILPGQDDD